MLLVPTLVLGAVVAFFMSPPRGVATSAIGAGQAKFDSDPRGAEVFVDGTRRGRTPLTLTLPVGRHTLRVAGSVSSRTLPIEIESGVVVAQFVDLGGAPVPARRGRLEISSTPTGAQVRVDGILQGVTPLTLDGLEAGSHLLSVSRGTISIDRPFETTAGGTTTMFVTLGERSPAAGAVGGFVTLQAPFELQVREDGRLLGTTSADRLMVPTGLHQFELVNADLQFRTTLAVDVTPGATTNAVVSVPNGSLSVNAAPWAEVSIDGRPVGTTPLANIEVPLGAHEIVFRHPQFGERRQSVTVRAQTPARVSVSLTP